MSSTLPQEFEKVLFQIEQQLGLVFEAVHDGDPAALEAASGNLRQISIDFSRMLDDQPQPLFGKEAQARLKKIAKDMVVLREGMARRMVGVERSLDVLMPEARRATTYAKPGGAYRSVSSRLQ